METRMKTRASLQSSRSLRIVGAVLLTALPAVCAVAQTTSGDAQPAPRIGMMTRHGLAGVVASVNGSSIVMEIPENVRFTVQTSSSTRIVGAGQNAALADIHPGDPILASGDIDEQARTIQAWEVTIQQPFAATLLEHQRASFGKTWTAGIVTAVQANAITLQRRDGQSQTFAVDEGTAWRLRDQEGNPGMLRVGESIRVQLRPGSAAARQVTIQGITRENLPTTQ